MTEQNDFAEEKEAFTQGIVSSLLAPKTNSALETLRWAGAYKTRRCALAITLGFESGHPRDIARRYGIHLRSLYKGLAKLRGIS
jgi:hypothetical protein